VNDDHLNIFLFEFALNVQRLIDAGWRLETIRYGDSCGGSSLRVRKGDRTENICDTVDMEDLLREETK
jgi:hypothetical protein